MQCIGRPFFLTHAHRDAPSLNMEMHAHGAILRGQRKQVGWKWFGCAVMSVAALAVPAQAPPSAHAVPRLIPRTSAEREQRFTALHRIILNVRVADTAGAPVNDLKQSDFTLLDNDQARSLVSFREVNAKSGGAHIVLVLDAANNFTRQLRHFANEIETYLKQTVEPLPVPVAIGVFSGFDIDVGQPSRDRAALLADLATRTADLHSTGCITHQEQPVRMGSPFSANGAGSNRAVSPQELACQNERFAESITALGRLARKEVQVPGRTILIWMGPGWPMLTDKAFAPDPPELKSNFFTQLVSLSMALRQAQVTVNAVGSPNLSISPQTPNVRDSAFFAGVASEEQASAADLGLHVLAHQTGGRIFPESKDIAGQIAACTTDAESYYVLTFDSAPAANFGEYHSLAVKVDKPNLDARTNLLYYAEQ